MGLQEHGAREPKLPPKGEMYSCLPHVLQRFSLLFRKMHLNFVHVDAWYANQTCSAVDGKVLNLKLLPWLIME